MRLPELVAQKKAAILREWDALTHAWHARSRLALEDRAEEERQRLRAVLEATPVGIFLVDNKGQLILRNCETRRIWGDHPVEGDLKDYSLFKGWWADGSERHGQPLKGEDWTLARCLRGEPNARDIVEIQPFGQPEVRRIVALNAAPVKAATGERIGCVVAQVDITDRVKAERALKESEAKFRTMANAMPQMLWSTRPDGYHDYYNDQWYEFTGRTPGSTDGEGWIDLFHPDDRDRTWASWHHCLETGQPYEIQYRLRHHSGQYRWSLGRALPVRDENGRIIRWMGSCTDIHAQKLAEEKLKKASERKDEFLAMLAHELRNPLAPIANAAQLLRLAAGENPKVGEYSDILVRQVKHLTDLVDDLLDVSRVTRGLIQLEREEADVKEIIRDALEQARGQIEIHRHELRVVLPEEPVFVHGDKSRLVQVIVNILNNAARYTPDGGRISLKLAVTEDHITIEITDNGYGIPAELQPHVFDLFTQGQRTVDRNQGGLGLGLSLVKSITRLHDGKVRVRSEGIDKGSTFTVVLPRLRRRHATVGDGKLAAAPQSPTHRQGPFKGPFHAAAALPAAQEALRLIIVDDNLDAANSLASLLQQMGQEVVVHVDAQAALQAADQDQADAFILDIGLPGMDGYELARRLRSRPDTQNKVLIALTGYGQYKDRKLALQAGFDHHFVKPVQADELLQALYLHRQEHRQHFAGQQDKPPRYH